MPRHKYASWCGGDQIQRCGGDSTMKRLLYALSFILLLMSAAELRAQPQWGTYAGDPSPGTLGFARNHVMQGHIMIAGWGPNNTVNNSVRAYDPSRPGGSQWLQLLCNELSTTETTDPCGVVYPSVGAHGRDNYASLYIESRRKLLIWGGSHYCDPPYGPQSPTWPSKWSGVMDLSACYPTVTTHCATWTATAAEANGYSPFCSLIKNCISWFNIDPACAWSNEADIGMCGFGSHQGPQNTYVLIVPNIAANAVICSGAGVGAEPYISCVKGTDNNNTPGAPPIRDQAMNLMAAGPNGCFYLFGGHYQDTSGASLNT